MNLENISLRFDIGQGKLDLSIDTPGTNQSRIQCFDFVGRHDHLDRYVRKNKVYERVSVGDECRKCASKV